MADAFDDENGNENEMAFTLDEYIDAAEGMELAADLILGGDDGKECTYKNGYMKRQAIFSCLTCTPDGDAGVCFACSLACHEGHEIIELWTKRKFRCDCGNSKFGEFFCKLFAGKDVENEENSYNHNFKGQYCTCGRRYPDPDAQEEIEMIQCCVCEDWFHEDHIGLDSSEEVPRDEEDEPLYEDFICQSCSGKCSFLSLYPETILVDSKKLDDANISKGKDVEVASAPSASEASKKLETGSCSSDPPHVGPSVATLQKSYAENCTFSGESSGAQSQLRECSQLTGPGSACLLGVDVVSALPSSGNSKPMFLSKSWREMLCKCSKCSELYAQKGIAFLLDPEDSIVEYEKTAKQRREKKLQEQEPPAPFGLTLPKGLGHIQKMEIMSGLAEMKDGLASFLASHDPSKTITADDVRDVFDNIKKRRRTE